jgi:hypothetical protein
MTCEARFVANYNGVDSDVQIVAVEKLDGCQDPGNGRMVSVGTVRETQGLAYREDKPKSLCSSVAKPLTITCQQGGAWSSPTLPAGHPFQNCEDGCYNSVRSVEGWYTSGQLVVYNEELPKRSVTQIQHKDNLVGTQCVEDEARKISCSKELELQCNGTVSNIQHSCRSNSASFVVSKSCSAKCETLTMLTVQRSQQCERGSWR